MKLESFEFPALTARARCLKVVDGDTLDLEVDVGFKLKFTSRFRILGINTPELRSSDPTERAVAADAKIALSELVNPENDCEWPLIVSIKKDPDNFGRYLASISVRDIERGILIDVGADLMKQGLAVVYKK